MEFSRLEYWCGQPFPSPGDLPNPGVEPGSPALQQILYQLSYPGSGENQKAPRFFIMCEAVIGALQISEVTDLKSFYLIMEWVFVLVLMVPVPLLPAKCTISAVN